jgi:hypothetical protein
LNCMLNAWPHVAQLWDFAIYLQIKKIISRPSSWAAN